jgi:hypothetical protein
MDPARAHLSISFLLIVRCRRRLVRGSPSRDARIHPRAHVSRSAHGERQSPRPPATGMSWAPCNPSSYQSSTCRTPRGATPTWRARAPTPRRGPTRWGSWVRMKTRPLPRSGTNAPSMPTTTRCSVPTHIPTRPPPSPSYSGPATWRARSCRTTGCRTSCRSTAAPRHPRSTRSRRAWPSYGSARRRRWPWTNGVSFARASRT